MKGKGRGHNRRSGALSISRVALIGGAVACALVLVVIINVWQNNMGPAEPNATENLPPASGENNGSTPTDVLKSDVGESAPGSSSPDTNSPDLQRESETDQSLSAAQIIFTDNNFELLRSDPDKYVNSTATISGKVYEVVDQSSGSLTMMTYRIHSQAIDSDESRAAIMFQEVRRTGTLPPDISVGDCISIHGRVRAGIGDYNSLGQSIRIPIIDSETLREVECIDSEMPASKSINANFTQSYAGVVLSVERVQFADGHLRVKITAKNEDVGDSVYIREKESQAEYRGHLYQSLNQLPVFRPYKLDSTIPAGLEKTGYLFFEPVPNFGGDPIVFKIVVEKVGISESEKSTFILKI